MEFIDLDQKEPKAPPKGFKTSVKKFLFYLVQWTWGLPVNIAGGIAFLICTKIKKRSFQRFGYSYIVYLPWKSGGLSMGLFIFINGNRQKLWTYNTRIHEYGHTWQALILGPLYYIVVAGPSAIWCNFLENYRKKNDISYYKLYCEAWANHFGQKFSKMTMAEEKR